MTEANEGDSRQAQAARYRDEGKSFEYVRKYYGYASAQEAEADYNAYMEKRRARFASPSPDR